MLYKLKIQLLDAESNIVLNSREYAIPKVQMAEDLSQIVDDMIASSIEEKYI